MKKLLAAALLLSGAASASADITVRFPAGEAKEAYEVQYALLSDIASGNAKKGETAQYTVKDDAFVIPVLKEGTAQYVFSVDDGNYIMVYAEPNDEITVSIENMKPLRYSVEGNAMMTDIARLDSEATAILTDYREMMERGEVTPEKMAMVQHRYDSLFLDYIEANPKSHGVAYALLHLAGDNFMNAYEGMTPEAKQSPLMYMVEGHRQDIEERMEAERRTRQLSSGTYTAPNFTFKDTEGKDVSMSQFRGKWVIIDFWGSWCGWCIKGFPKLKEAYAALKDRVEIIGVDCQDSYETWQKAVKKYELPWVNVYNPEEGGNKVLEAYAVQGFPTKVIVDPEGKIRNITAGEDPAFYETLLDLLNIP